MLLCGWSYIQWAESATLPLLDFKLVNSVNDTITFFVDIDKGISLPHLRKPKHAGCTTSPLKICQSGITCLSGQSCVYFPRMTRHNRKFGRPFFRRNLTAFLAADVLYRRREHELNMRVNLWANTLAKERNRAMTGIIKRTVDHDF